jgi:hypothetical protein
MKVNVKELKEKYGKIFKLDIPTDNGEKTLYLRKIDRLTYKAAMSMMEKDELEASSMILRALTVEGDAEEIISEFDDLRVASSLLIEVIGTRTGNVVAL